MKPLNSPTPNQNTGFVWGFLLRVIPKGFMLKTDQVTNSSPDFLMQLDAKNPQVASRMLGAL